MHLQINRRVLFSIAILLVIALNPLPDVCAGSDSQVAALWKIGFGKIDVTPNEPVRLSGYATRDRAHEAVADPLYARAMVLTAAEPPDSDPQVSFKPQKSVVIVSVDSIAVLGDMTRRIAERLSVDYGLSRGQIVICSTHSHAAPHASSGLSNLFRNPLSDAETVAIDRNTARVEQGILQAVAKAMESRKPGRLELGSSEVTFAVNRRVLKNGVWSGFGRQTDGPVDHRVRLLRAVNLDGRIMGAAYMYACHATTLGPNFNRVSADWPGLAATELERKNDGCVFVPIIGCGADANPEPRTSYQDALNHGAAMAASIESALRKQSDDAWQSLIEFPVAHFGFAGLAPEMPTRAELESLKSDSDVVRRRWANSMLSIWDKMGRLPETYPAPIHTWRFGNELLWVFLGGEVVVDYQMRLEKNLTAKEVWVAAYTDDVFAYVASERMRAEGGYEVDGSMLYYNQPGRWQSGTEDLIERRVKEIMETETAADQPLGPAAALKAIRVPDDFQVDLVVAEPLIDDPVNIAFGHDGRVWLVEMSDYPLGTEGGGRVRALRDTDGDGRLDESKLFLTGLDYPTSVTPWRDGVIVIEAPNIFFAADRDGDGKAEVRENLLIGIGKANPQHRASGFELGLDGWLHFTSGDDTTELTSSRNGKTINVSRRDVCWQPDTGEFFTTGGLTQFVRGRDEFGNFFGNVNNQPMFHYVIEDAYRSRGSMSGPGLQHLLDPPVAPPVYPYSRTLDRFNDLFTFNRFTSACSSIVCRVPGLGEEMRGAALVCEPVHNLVARFHVRRDGASFLGDRFKEDEKFDWFASSDPFSRPVRAVNAPDGTIWILDMVRQVIEHPQWIPTAWQSRLNLRSGSGLGRIYRVSKKGFVPRKIPLTERAAEQDLVQWLSDDNGAVRDLASQQLIWRGSLLKNTLEALEDLVKSDPRPAVKAQALGTLAGLGHLRVDHCLLALQDDDPRVRRCAATLAERLLNGTSVNPTREPGPTPQFETLNRICGDERDAGVLTQLMLTLGGISDGNLKGAIESMASHAASDAWLSKATSLVHDMHVEPALQGGLSSIQIQPSTNPSIRPVLEQTINSLWSRNSAAVRNRILAEHFPAAESNSKLTDIQVLLLTAVAGAGIDKLTNDEQLQDRLVAATVVARQRLFAEGADLLERARLVPLLSLPSSKPNEMQQKLQDIIRLLGPREAPEIQQSALAVARRLRLDETPNAVLAKWSEMLPDVRSSVCSLLLERRNWGEQLIVALESGQVKVSDLDAALIERLRSYGDRNLIARSQRVLGKPPDMDRNRVVNEMISKMPESGDRQRGEKLFTEHCAVCHRATPQKPIVGPPIDNLSNWTKTQWIVAILDPNRTIEPKYHQYSLLTQDGLTLAGLIEDRSSHSLTLASADGKRHEVKLDDIDQMRDLGVSLMPQGLETKLAPEGVADLLTYLQTIGRPSDDKATMVPSKPANAIRVATYNVSLNRKRANQLTEDLLKGDKQARAIATVIRAIQPDVILLNELDYSADMNNARIFVEKYLADSALDLLGNGPWDMPYQYAGPVNTGVPSGLDQNGNGKTNDPEDAWGFGHFPGQYGMAVLSRIPIDEDMIRTFQLFKWSKMPNAMMPREPRDLRPYYKTEVWTELRLASKSFWDIPVKSSHGRFSLLASHPTPPAFDGPADHNGCRNHDEIRLLNDYITPSESSYLQDDRGQSGGIADGQPFVIVGDLNSDPVDGESRHEAIKRLISHARIVQTPAPVSRGAVEAHRLQAKANVAQKSAPESDTADFSDGSVGNLRVDYVLPSKDFAVQASGVFWPSEIDWPEKKGIIKEMMNASDHHLVWMDLIAR